MKIAITGGTTGIGKALLEHYIKKGHTVMDYSKRNGWDIIHHERIAERVAQCDWFFNNAQQGYAQTELLFGVYEYWKDKPGKKIINISSMMAGMTVSCLPGYDMLKYHHQKRTLESAVEVLRNKMTWPQLVTVRPGKVDTQGEGGADVTAWVSKLVRILEEDQVGMEIYDISLA